jgi:prepilin signal peptidase PulO-like enzyme (type II secretory pathway)
MIVIMEIVILIALILFGLVFGSFAGATVWRLRARQLVADKKAGETVNKSEYAELHKLAVQKVGTDRSRCLHCGYTLHWYDLIPVFSWLALKGRCRQCRKRIGRMEPLIELGVAAFFVLSYSLWPATLDAALPIALFALWLAAGVGMAILFVYDAKWYLLPDKINFALIGIGLVGAVLMTIASLDPVATIVSILISVGILSGIYFVIYLVSRGQWIGFGDIKLGLALGLLLSDWQLALIALFFANLFGCMVVIPLLLAKKIRRTSPVPFGPFLILGAIFAKLVGMGIAEFYMFGLM